MPLRVLKDKTTGRVGAWYEPPDPRLVEEAAARGLQIAVPTAIAFVDDKDAGGAVHHVPPENLATEDLQEETADSFREKADAAAGGRAGKIFLTRNPHDPKAPPQIHALPPTPRATGLSLADLQTIRTETPRLPTDPITWEDVAAAIQRRHDKEHATYRARHEVVGRS